jgi:protein O-GlcNAc transferase
MRLADLFLDTLPFNAGTTASDALWAGRPLLTCPGRSFAARMAGSLLNALDLPELIADSPSHYETLAVELAHDSKRLA